MIGNRRQNMPAHGMLDASMMRLAGECRGAAANPTSLENIAGWNGLGIVLATGSAAWTNRPVKYPMLTIPSPL
jgi:hypothetical protein